MNVRSVRNKTTYLSDHISTCKYDIVVLSETWLLTSDEADEVCVNELLPSGYNIHRVDRNTGQRGGGLAVIYKNNIRLKFHKQTHFVQFECVGCTLNINSYTLNLYGVYRPPPTAQNGLTTSSFIAEWSQFLSELTVSSAEIIILGDVNIHMDQTSQMQTRNFNESLQTTALQQHIHEPTHYRGHTIDVLISRDDDRLVKDINVTDIGLTDNNGKLNNDHYAITFSLLCYTNEPRTKQVSYRKLRKINTDILKHDIKLSTILNNTNGTVEELTTNYISGITELIDAHAPLLQRTVLLRPHAPWYNEETLDAKKKRRILEKAWREKKLPADKKKWRDQCAVVGVTLFHAKSHYYSTKIEECGKDVKSLCKITDTLLKNEHRQQLPNVEDTDTLPKQFQEYFEQKIETIRASFATPHTVVSQLNSHHIPLNHLRPATEDEILRTIVNSPSKSCALDPLPTWLLKTCVNELLPLLTAIVNASLSKGQFPSHFKEAIVRPLLKKPHLDPDQLKNYRPVSNLHFISKIIEKIVMERLNCHITVNDLHVPVQSAYKRAHSTETALLKINNDILGGMDRNMCTILASLDLSAAFDTVDHSIFISKLQNEYSIGGNALLWFKSYLEDRKQKITVNGNFSELHSLQCGVPQGSVLGASMYTMYTRQLSDVIRRHGVMHHSYADDIQIYIRCNNSADACTRAAEQLRECIKDICEWMTTNALKLNQDKTELIVFSKSTEPQIIEIKIGDDMIQSSSTIKVLGVTLDSNITLNQHISNTCRSIYMNIRKIRRIKPYLSNCALRILIQHMVISRLDYCNSLYNGLTVKAMNKLQLSQNTAARLISGKRKYDHISGTLRDLHWLPVNKRCQFKLLVLIYNALHGNSPIYISEMLNWYHPTRSLRSSAYPSLVPNRNNTVKYGRRLCDTSCAVLWNSLPVALRSATSVQTFKKQLKTHLF